MPDYDLSGDLEKLHHCTDSAVTFRLHIRLSQQQFTNHSGYTTGCHNSNSRIPLHSLYETVCSVQADRWCCSTSFSIEFIEALRVVSKCRLTDFPILKWGRVSHTWFNKYAQEMEHVLRFRFPAEPQDQPEHTGFVELHCQVKAAGGLYK